MTARCADAFAEQARQTPHTHTLPQLSIPAEVNYIGAFLTLECNLACAYCINDPSQAGCRKGLFAGDGMSPSDWVRGLARLPVSADLPITLQGGEPMIYRGGRGVADILAGSEHWFDLLTNLVVKSERVIEALAPNAAKLRRQAPYPSVRVSYH
ncbi:MAG TPA: radical SAM protein, partial [Magnetospirillum sp.]|nr:radical SAM protein [Magnetospirillum sp.]